MELKQQVCSLELAHKLKELGVRQDAQFCWSIPKSEDAKELSLPSVYRHDMEWGEDYEPIAAFTVAELGEMLPHSALGAYFNEFKGQDDWSMAYGLEKTIRADTEAEARAKMIIFLLENKLIKV